MAKYAVHSNNSEGAAEEESQDDKDSAKLNQSCRAECDSQLGSANPEDDFCVDGSRPFFQDQFSDINCSDG